MSFHAEMLEISQTLYSKGIEAIVPESDIPLLNALNDQDFNEIKRVVGMRHIRKIRDHKKTYGILVVNRDKHGVPDYIGPNTFAEIAVAFAHYKKIFLFQGIPEFYNDELTAWNVQALHGNLDSLIEECKEAQMQETLQISLFDSPDTV
jgi:hypothetical protein